MPDSSLTIKCPEAEYKFDLARDITAVLLRHVKGWYPGDEIGQNLPLQVAIGQGDVEAVASVMWACRRTAGYSPNLEPKRIPDFSIGEVLIRPNKDEDSISPKWMLRMDDDEMVFEPEVHIRASHLRRIAKRYPLYRRYVRLLVDLRMGDPDAVASCIWIARDAHGIAPNPLPWDLGDFSIEESSKAIDEDDDDERLITPKEVPDETPLSNPTSAPSGTDMETLTNSGIDGGSSSDVSVTSDPESSKTDLGLSSSTSVSTPKAGKTPKPQQ